MNKKLKFASAFLATSLVVTPVSSLVSNFDNVAKAERNHQVSPQSVGGATLFFGGILIGWVAGGVIKYSTGKAPEEWVTMGLQKIENDIKTLHYTVSISGNYSGNYQIHINKYGKVYKKCIKYPCIVDYSKPITDVEI